MMAEMNQTDVQTTGQSLPYLIVGLGNPGREYRDSRHNIGFMTIDRLAGRLGTRFTRMEARALVTKATYHDRRLILAKPQAFMNLSGQAVSGLVHFYKIPLEHLLVVYDDIDLPLGRLRLRENGGSAGHKGMQSIIEKLNTSDFSRLRLGIGRPPGRKTAADYVLKEFSGEEADFLPVLLDRAVDAILAIVTEGLPAAMNRYNPPELEQ
jgi:PTH1 family peptidyl-tRNA hydrolase